MTHWIGFYFNAFALYWSWIEGRNKIRGANIVLRECYCPRSGVHTLECIYPHNEIIWDDNTYIARLEVDGIGDLAYVTVLWFLKPCLGVKSIGVIGKWHVNGIWPNEFFNEVYTIDTSLPKLSKLTDSKESNRSISENNEVKVFAEADAIVVERARVGERIQVYSTAGLQIKSIVANDARIKVKLPANHIYFVTVGQEHYKIAL